MAVYAQLEAALKERRFVCLHRRFSHEPRLNGVVLGVSASLVLVAQFHDFYAEGYAVLRLDDVASVVFDERQQFWETMLRGEGMLASIGTATVPLTSFDALLTRLRGALVIVECETEVEENNLFEVGRVLNVDERSVRFRYVDPGGHWDNEPDEILLDSITKVQFDTPYVRMFAKYARSD